jgi:hypothetical protein
MGVLGARQETLASNKCAEYIGGSCRREISDRSRIPSALFGGGGGGHLAHSLNMRMEQWRRETPCAQ